MMFRAQSAAVLKMSILIEKNINIKSNTIKDKLESRNIDEMNSQYAQSA